MSAQKPRIEAGTQINAWLDDPVSTPNETPKQTAVPNMNAKPLGLKIDVSTSPVPALYPQGTPDFRYWCAAEALRRAANFWSQKLPPATTWQPGSVLLVHLDVGTDLNAYYDRKGLDFFHDTVSGATIYSGESPDVLCHELGHAVLDAIRPELWDAASDEIAAFHESFGDMSSILSALQLPVLRDAVLNETQCRLYQSSRLSRLAEQLGWAIRQRYPDAVDQDCLRNAMNKFVYAPPVSLPHDGPSSALTSESHSFSRVFTAAFYEILSGIFELQDRKDSDALVNAGDVVATLLIYSISTAPIVPDYYSQIAMHMVEGALKQFDGKYAATIKSAFVRRGILSSEAAALPLENQTIPSRFAGVAGSATAVVAVPKSLQRKMELPLVGIQAQNYGLGQSQLFVRVASETRTYRAAAAAQNIGTAPSLAAEDSAKSFVEDLFRRGEVDVSKYANPVTRDMHQTIRKTHRVMEADGGSLILQRIRIQ